jgi:hypothetical protein
LLVATAGLALATTSICSVLRIGGEKALYLSRRIDAELSRLRALV